MLFVPSLTQFRGTQTMRPTTSSARGTVLVVDDNTANLKVASEYLKIEHFEVLTARDGETGIERAKLGQPDLILLDVQMPGIDGFETCRRLKADEQTKAIPIVFMTALTSVEDKLMGFASGGIDYVTKPFQLEELLARVSTHISVYQLQRELQAEIHERQLAEARTRQFVADASHELRSPMTVLGGYLEVLLMGAKDDPVEAERIFKVMQNEVGRLSRMVVDLLTLTRFDTSGRGFLRLEEVNLADLMRRVQDNFKMLADGRRVELAIEEEVAATTVIGDGDQLYQVVSNLMDNALRYIAPDGLICLSLSRAVVLPPALESSAKPDWLVMKVADNGCGIEPDKLPFIFDRFYRADRSRTRRTGNAGLGLPISKSIVEAHGGIIEVASQVGVGTTFSIFLDF